MPQQNFYVQLDSNNKISQVSPTYKSGWIPVAIDLSHLSDFNSDPSKFKYDKNAEAIKYPAPFLGYGAMTDFDNNGTSIMQRFGLAKGITQAGVNGKSNAFDNIMPWSGMKEVHDSKGNAFIRIPKCYLGKDVSKVQDSGNTGFKVSMTPFSGSYLPECFIDHTTGATLPYVDVGKYVASFNGNNLVSVPNVDENSNGSYSLDQLRQGAQANGSGYQVMDYSVMDLLSTLEAVEFANLNNYQLFGLDSNNAPEDINTGWSNKQSGSSNSTSGGHANYRGVEDLFTQANPDNVGIIYDGIFMDNNGSIGFYKDPKDYSGDGTSGNIIDTGAYTTGELTSDLETKYPFLTILNATIPDSNNSDYYTSADLPDVDAGYVFSLDSGDSGYSSPFGVYYYDGGASASDFGGRLVKKPL